MEFQWYLNEKDFFSGLSDEKKLFLSLAKKRAIRKNEFLFSAGEKADSAFYLQSGEVGISHLTAKGKESLVFIRHAGELFGLAEVIVGAKRACNARAITPCCLFEIKRHELENLLSRHWALSKRVMEILGGRLRYLGEQLESLMSCDVTTRLLKLLFYLSRQNQKGNGPAARTASITIPLKLTQEQIAAMIGSCQQTVSGILNQLQHEGLISLSRNHREITILKPARLINSL